MAYIQLKDIRIAGIATAVPKQTINNKDLIAEFGEKRINRFIRTTGVLERRVASEYQTASDLGVVATEELFKKKGIDKKTIGALVFASHGPDYKRPATAHVIQKRLELSEQCACFDISLGCSAFVYGIQILGGLMQTSDIEKALLIVGDTNSKLINPKDESMVLLAGDAGSAVLLEKKNGSQISAELVSNGEKYKTVIVPAGGMRNLHAGHREMKFDDGYDRTLYNLFMDGFGVFQYTIREVPRILKDFVAKEKKEMGDYDYYVMHQANQYILQQLSKRAKMPSEKMLYSIQEFGNTSSASVPLTLCKCFGEEAEGEIAVLMSGFGVGLSCGVMSANINKKDILPLIESDDYFEEGIINNPEDWQVEREEM